MLALSIAMASTAQAATPMLALSDSGPVGGSTCALTQSGKVYCWGSNVRGELGTNVVDSGSGVAALQLVPLPKPAAQIASGVAHTCALLEDATVYCWGLNYHGQLGNGVNTGTLNANPNPSPVPLAAPASRLAAGSMNTCVIYAAGTTGCLGDNSFGQLGFSPTGSLNTTPKAISLGGAAAKKIAIGGNYACVLLTTLSVKCMGFNPSGQLGNNAHLGSGGSTPVTAGLSGPAADLETGSGHACAILQDLTTWCWGDNSLGQLGIGAADETDHFNPLKVSIGSAQLLAMGGTHTCTRLLAGGVDCWGSNLTGQLGVPDNITTFTPNPTPLLSSFEGNASAVDAGGPHTCVILPAGSVKCAGDNSDGQLGVPSTDLGYSYIPVTVPGLNVNDAASPASAKLALLVAKPTLKFKKSGAKISATARAKVNGIGASVPSADCVGKVSTRLERKVVTGSGKKRKTSYKSVVSKTAKLSVKKQQCGFDLSLKLTKKYNGKKLYLRVTLKDGARTTGFNTRFSTKIKRLKF